MREIRFRAWWPNVKKMKFFVPGNFEDTAHGYAMTFIQPGEDGSIYLGEAAVMQYTGLKDKNGKEIYEGDIVNENFEDFGDNRAIKQIVEYKAGAFYPVCMQPSTTFEVIGNIHENPELIP